MPYYQLAFNKPLAAFYTYRCDRELPRYVRVEAPLGSRCYAALLVEQTPPQVAEDLRLRGIDIKEIRKVVDDAPVITDELFELAKWMSEYYAVSMGECLFAMTPSAKKEKPHDAPQELISRFADAGEKLTADQQRCFDAICAAAAQKSPAENPVENPAAENSAKNTADKKKPLYLYGITGSGKTEVFLRAAEAVAQTGKQVIYLVPEISLARQLYPLMQQRFGAERLALLHSALTPSQRLSQWRRVLSGEAAIVLGVRSAVFAPAKNLGLIIIDEEHDGAYKSDTAPRYHARQVALKRSHLTSCALVMGSATPSLESSRLMQAGAFETLRLHERVSGGEVPEIEIVSLQNTAGIISVPLQKQLQQTVAAGRQALLLMNRRGFSSAFLCSHCGHAVLCKNCSVQLVMHKKNGANMLVCHHCGYSQAAPSSCPSCGYTSMSVRGWGTQRVEQEVQSLFPNVSVARFDSDVASDKEAASKVLGDFYRGDISILVGTQIIAKGINIPNLQLVGVLCADHLFSLPDFRASERALQLLTQASGRAGRFAARGKVVIQTYAPENPLLKALREGAQDEFYQTELGRRSDFGFPPFSRIIRLVLRGKNKQQVDDVADRCVRFARAWKDKHKTISVRGAEYERASIRVMGPADCAISKISENYRVHVLLCAPSLAPLHALLRELLDGAACALREHAQKKRVYVEIDPDAQQLM